MANIDVDDDDGAAADACDGEDCLDENAQKRMTVDGIFQNLTNGLKQHVVEFALEDEKSKLDSTYHCTGVYIVRYLEPMRHLLKINKLTQNPST